jgi:hypothetical protein
VGGWALGQLWLFIVAPILEAVIASLVFKALGTVTRVISTQKAERALDRNRFDRGIVFLRRDSTVVARALRATPKPLWSLDVSNPWLEVAKKA